MGLKVEPPIFLIEGRDLAVFESVGDAERHLEAPYLDNSSFDALDSRGRRLSVDAVGAKVVFSLDDTVPPDPDKLERAIRDYLSAIGDERATEAGCDLPCLIRLSARHTTKGFLRRGGG